MLRKVSLTCDVDAALPVYALLNDLQLQFLVWFEIIISSLLQKMDFYMGATFSLIFCYLVYSDLC